MGLGPAISLGLALLSRLSEMAGTSRDEPGHDDSAQVENAPNAAAYGRCKKI
jgi:hypothetical protein